MPFFAGRWRAESTSSWGPSLLIWTVYLKGSVHNCHPVTPLSCPWEGCLYLASVMDPLRPGSHVFFHGFLLCFSWEHPLETYMSAHNFVLLSQMFSCLVRFRCLRWKSGFCRIFERTAPNFGASSVAIEKSDVILILDPLNLNFKKNLYGNYLIFSLLLLIWILLMCLIVSFLPILLLLLLIWKLLPFNLRKFSWKIFKKIISFLLFYLFYFFF